MEHVEIIYNRDRTKMKLATVIVASEVNVKPVSSRNSVHVFFKNDLYEVLTAQYFPKINININQNNSQSSNRENR